MPPTTWQIHARADGYGMTSATGAIRVRERVAPLRTARSIVAAEQLVVVDSERITTHEGELGSLVRLAGDRSLGLVFGEDFYVRIDGTGPAIHDAVRERVLDVKLGLGASRRRRCVYTPPRGWTPHPRGLTDEWLAPQFPNDSSAIIVYPAVPITAGTLVGIPFTTTHFRRAAIARSGDRDTVMLQDDRYTYCAQLEARADVLAGHRDVFAALVESIEPLPVPSATPHMAYDHHLVASWVE